MKNRVPTQPSASLKNIDDVAQAIKDILLNYEKCQTGNNHAPANKSFNHTYQHSKTPPSKKQPLQDSENKAPKGSQNKSPLKNNNKQTTPHKHRNLGHEISNQFLQRQEAISRKKSKQQFNKVLKEEASIILGKSPSTVGARKSNNQKPIHERTQDILKKKQYKIQQQNIRKREDQIEKEVNEQVGNHPHWRDRFRLRTENLQDLIADPQIDQIYQEELQNYYRMSVSHVPSINPVSEALANNHFYRKQMDQKNVFERLTQEDPLTRMQQKTPRIVISKSASKLNNKEATPTKTRKQSKQQDTERNKQMSPSPTKPLKAGKQGKTSKKPESKSPTKNPISSEALLMVMEKHKDKIYQFFKKLEKKDKKY